MQWRRMLKMSEQAKKRHSRIELDFLPRKYANRSVERRVYNMHVSYISSWEIIPVPHYNEEY